MAAAKGATRLDGWYNLTSGLGTSRDKRTSAQFQRVDLLSPLQCEWLFTGDDLANTIVTAIVDDATREGFSVEPSDPEADEGDRKRAGELTDQILKLRAWPALREGAIWGRLYGRGGVLVVTNGAAGQDQPLAEGSKRDVLAVVPVERQELAPRQWNDNPLSLDYGQPSVYALNPTASGTVAPREVLVHASRLILFPGADTPKRVRAENEGCDLSVLQKAYETLKGANGNWDSVCSMMADMSQAVIKMQGLIDGISAGQSDSIAERIALMDQMRSTVRAILLDADGEEFGYAERGALTGVGDLVDKTFTRLAAAAQMPVSRLMGISAAGLNATGEGDRKAWYDRVRSYQRDVLAPGLLRLVEILDPGGRWRVCFPDLEKMSPLEEADLRGKVASTDKAYIDAGVVLPEEVALSRWGSGQYSAEMRIDLEPRQVVVDRDLEAMEDDQPEPPTGPAPGVGEGDPVGQPEGAQGQETAPAEPRGDQGPQDRQRVDKRPSARRR